MKKLFASIFIALFCAAFAFAQTETPKSPDWQTFAPDGEEFSIEVPILLKTSMFPNVNPENISRRYLNSVDGTFLYIFSDDAKKPIQFEFVSAFANFNKPSEKVEKMGSFEVTKFEFVDKEDFYHTIFTVKGKNRYYVFQIISPNKNDPLVARFFESLKLKDKEGAETAISPKTKESVTALNKTENVENKPVEVIKPLSGNENGSGSGNGKGSGNGDKTSSQPTPSIVPNPNNQTTGIKILTKPKAFYTDFARFYEISGKVVLRVTFAADGTIGGISAISKLPFGLTAQAIAAVKGIKFEPAMRNGTAYTVQKPVEYSFTIY